MGWKVSNEIVQLLKINLYEICQLMATQNSRQHLIVTNDKVNIKCGDKSTSRSAIFGDFSEIMIKVEETINITNPGFPSQNF